MGRAEDTRPTVFLHIGPPKTGTTYLQDTLRRRRAELRRVGVLFPAAPTTDLFGAALDARGDAGFGAGAGSEVPLPRAAGAWGRLVGKAGGYDGTVVISHELFATADQEHARAAVDDLSHTDLHLVVTARDPARQLMSAWQQRIKHGSDEEFATVAKRVADKGRMSRAQELPQLLKRWGSSLPTDHVHVVTVPPSGGDPSVLWSRFAAVIGVDPAQILPPDGVRTNDALGAAEIEVLRRVVAALDGRIPHPEFGRTVTRDFATELLAAIRTSSKSVVPVELRATIDAIAERWIGSIADAGYHVSGDLDDLRPRYQQGSAPSDVSDRAVADAAVYAVADMLVARADHSRSKVPSAGSALRYLQGRGVPRRARKPRPTPDS